VGPGELPLSNNFNNVFRSSPTKTASASKNEFRELSSSTRVRNSHIFARAHNDLYVEPGWCSERLFAVEQFLGVIWDPCRGTDTIAAALRWC
jgi:hypothetical protein